MENDTFFLENFNVKINRTLLIHLFRWKILCENGFPHFPMLDSK